MDQEKAENLRDKLDDRHDEIVDYVGKNSPQPSVDRDAAERLLSHAPPAQAATELENLIEGFESGAGAATGRRTEPASENSPTEDLVDPQPEPGISGGGGASSSNAEGRREPRSE